MPFGPAVDRELSSRLAELSTKTSMDTALQVLRYLETLPMRYQSYALEYIAHWIFATLIDAPGMASSYATFCKVLQHLVSRTSMESGWDQTASTREALPIALLKESRKALTNLCEEDSARMTADGE